MGYVVTQFDRLSMMQLPVQRGRVTVENITFINALLYRRRDEIERVFRIK